MRFFQAILPTTEIDVDLPAVVGPFLDRHTGQTVYTEIRPARRVKVHGYPTPVPDDAADALAAHVLHGAYFTECSSSAARAAAMNAAETVAADAVPEQVAQTVDTPLARTRRGQTATSRVETVQQQPATDESDAPDASDLDGAESVSGVANKQDVIAALVARGADAASFTTRSSVADVRLVAAEMNVLFPDWG